MVNVVAPTAGLNTEAAATASASAETATDDSAPVGDDSAPVGDDLAPVGDDSAPVGDNLAPVGDDSAMPVSNEAALSSTEDTMGLQARISELEKDLQTAQDGVSDWQRKHKNYISGKQREIKKFKDREQDLTDQLANADPSERKRLREENDKMKNDLADSHKVAVKSVQLNDSTKTHCKAIYYEIIRLATDALDAKVNSTPLPPRPSPANLSFQFEMNGKWMDIGDDDATSALQSLVDDASKDTVQYRIGSHTYSVHRRKPHEVSARPDVLFVQTNTTTKFARYIRKGADDGDAALIKRNCDILFNPKCWIQLPDVARLSEYLTEYRYDVALRDEISVELAQLCEKWSALASGFKYTSTNASKIKTELWIKPLLLLHFLQIALERGYTHMRMGMHGSGHYEEMRKDSYCFNLQHAGLHGKVYGNGIYLSNSDEGCQSYNKPSKLPDGSGLLCLYLTTGHLKTHNGGYTPKMDFGEGYEQCATLFNLGGFGTYLGYKNCTVVHDQYLILPLGKCVRIEDP